MAKRKKKSGPRGNADKIKESNDILKDVQSKRQVKLDRMEQIKDNKDEESLEEVRKLIKEINELDKLKRWNEDRIKMLNNYNREK